MVIAWLNQKVLYPLFDRLAGHKITAFYDEYMQSQWEDTKWFQRMRDFITYAYKTIPYYQELFDKNNIRPEDIKTREDLLKIPVLTREHINKYKDKMINKDYRLSQSQSGGSTGEPITFFLSQEALDAHKAIGMRFYSMMGLKLGDRTVRIWGQPRVINAVNTVKGKIFERLNNRLFLDGFDLTEDTMGRYVKKIKRFRPKLIMGYVQCIDLLAQYIQKYKIKGIQPKAVFTTTSVLYPDIRRRVEKTFGCKVFNEYGSCEIGAIAHECSNHKGMHIDTEIAFVEFIKDGKIAEPGEDAELVITTLCNKGMPLIRYKIGDIGSYTEEPCSCGRNSIRIQHILGRTFGVFTALDGRKVHGYYFTNRVFMKMENVKQFQMIQETMEDYLVKIVKNPKFDEKDVSFIEKMLKEKLGDINIRYKYLDKIHPESSGKFLYTKSYVKEGYIS
jgi:phenylacetate-CoA ligase